MAEEYKSSKTRQVMNLINAPSSDTNPLLPGGARNKTKKKLPQEQTVEESLKSYTVSKRGGADKHAVKKPSGAAIHNPILHIPEEEQEPEEAVSTHNMHQMRSVQPMQPMRPMRSVRSVQPADEKITIDINRIFLADMLDDALARFNTCHCDKCKEKITELVLESVPVKIITVSPADEKSVMDSYCEHTKKDLSSALVKIIVANKRKPFHDMVD